LPNRLVDFEYAIELLILARLSAIEGHVALSTAWHDVNGLLVCYLQAETGLAEEVEARQLDWFLVYLEAYRALHLIAKLLV